jgi:2-amino-4-hydroxy-6-hydroxymethyldihydropteridine diphosphokinase
VPRAVLGLGGNLGARRALLSCARLLLAEQPGLALLASSRLYHTPPLRPPQPDYLNAALLVDWVGSARALLALTQHIELLLRRQRNERWGSRTLDIDILYWSAGPVREPGLTVPHPELGKRAFALVPLLEVAPQLRAEPELGLPPTALGMEADFARAETFGELVCESPDGALYIGPHPESSELASAFVDGVARFAGPAPRAAAVLPFACSGWLGAEPPLDTLLEQLHARSAAAFKQGFFVRKAAITSVGPGRCEGVFVGAHGARQSVLPLLCWRLESGIQGQALRLNHV